MSSSNSIVGLSLGLDASTLPTPPPPSPMSLQQANPLRQHGAHSASSSAASSSTSPTSAASRRRMSTRLMAKRGLDQLIEQREVYRTEQEALEMLLEETRSNSHSHHLATATVDIEEATVEPIRRHHLSQHINATKRRRLGGRTSSLSLRIPIHAGGSGGVEEEDSSLVISPPSPPQGPRSSSSTTNNNAHNVPDSLIWEELSRQNTEESLVAASAAMIRNASAAPSTAPSLSSSMRGAAAPADPQLPPWILPFTDSLAPQEQETVRERAERRLQHCLSTSKRTSDRDFALNYPGSSTSQQPCSSHSSFFGSQQVAASSSSSSSSTTTSATFHSSQPAYSDFFTKQEQLAHMRREKSLAAFRECLQRQHSGGEEGTHSASFTGGSAAATKSKRTPAPRDPCRLRRPSSPHPAKFSHQPSSSSSFSSGSKPLKLELTATSSNSAASSSGYEMREASRQQHQLHHASGPSTTGDFNDGGDEADDGDNDDVEVIFSSVAQPDWSNDSTFSPLQRGGRANDSSQLQLPPSVKEVIRKYVCSLNEEELMGGSGGGGVKKGSAGGSGGGGVKKGSAGASGGIKNPTDTNVGEDEDSNASTITAAFNGEGGDGDGDDEDIVCVQSIEPQKSLLSLTSKNQELQQRLHCERGRSAMLEQRLGHVESQLRDQRIYSQSLVESKSLVEKNLDESKTHVTKLKGELDALKQETTCVICFEARREVVFLPCWHFQCCDTCSTSLAECCYCRKPLRGKVQVFQ